MPEMLHNLIQSFQKTHEVAFNILFYREEMKHKSPKTNLGEISARKEGKGEWNLCVSSG